MRDGEDGVEESALLAVALADSGEETVAEHQVGLAEGYVVSDL